MLRYLPNTTDAFYVDAATGDLVNLTELQAKLRQQYDAAAGDMKTANTTLRVEAAADEGEATLTDVELEAYWTRKRWIKRSAPGRSWGWRHTPWGLRAIPWTGRPER